MLLGALLDAGVAESELRARLHDLALPGFALTVSKVQKVGIGAVKVDVQVTDHATERHVPAIIDLVERSAVADNVKRRAAAIFRRLGEVEAAIHGTTPERVHLHELGGIDTIVDVVGVLIGFDLLGWTRWCARRCRWRAGSWTPRTGGCRCRRRPRRRCWKGYR